MSAQAVLSMIASGLPATPQGPSRGEDASGFRGLLASVLAPEGDDGAVASDVPSTPSRIKSGDADGSELLVSPGQVEAKEPPPQIPPQILPGTEPSTEAEPPVPPELVEAKDQQPQNPPGATTEDAEPLILPIAVDTKQPEPQVQPGTAPGKPAEPNLPPESPAPRGPGPQIPSGAAEAKGDGPQVPAATAEAKGEGPLVPAGSDPAQVAPPTASGKDTVKAAATSVASDHDRSPTAAAQPQALQPPPPALRPLAERTSRPLDDARAGSSSTPMDVKATGPAAAPASTPAEPPARPAPQTAPTQAAPPADASAPRSDEGHSTGGAPTGQAEGAAAPRDHSLSTLSRASIDATAQIAAQIQRRLEGRSTRFEIALRPAELGRVDVKLDIDSEGRLTARLAFDNPAAATDLRGRADELRRQLETAGFQMADDAFEFAERDSGSSAFDRGQDARHGQNRAFAAAARLNAEIDVAQPPPWLALSLSPSGVDMKV